MAWHKSNPVSQRLASVPGIGPIIATAIAATVVEPSGFRSGREFAAWLGLVPRQNSTGGKHRLGGISKRGNQYLRRLLINGASANLLRSKATNADPWVIGLRQRRPSLVVAVALANKTARIAWAVMHRHENYQRVADAELIGPRCARPAFLRTLSLFVFFVLRNEIAAWRRAPGGRGPLWDGRPPTHDGPGAPLCWLLTSLPNL